MARCEAQASHWRLKVAMSTPEISKACRPKERRKSTAVSAAASSDDPLLAACVSIVALAVPLTVVPFGVLSSRLGLFRQSISAPLPSAYARLVSHRW
jgi:hypothetical protein